MPPGEDNRSSQAGPPHGEASTSPAPLHASSQAGEDSTLPQAGATPPGEDASLSQVSTPLTPLPSHPTSPGEDASLSQVSTPLTSLPSQPTPPGEDASLSQVSTPPTPLPSQPTALLPSLEDRGPPNLPNTQAGQSNNPTNYPRQGSRQPPRQRPPQASQEVHTTSREGNNSTSPPLGIPRVLLKKNLTLSGSLTFPTNP